MRKKLAIATLVAVLAASTFTVASADHEVDRYGEPVGHKVTQVNTSPFKLRFVASITLPPGGLYLVEAKVVAHKHNRDPQWIKLAFERHDGDITGGLKFAWIPGEDQQLTATHITRAKGGTRMRVRVNSDVWITLSQVQFKVIAFDRRNTDWVSVVQKDIQ